MPDASRSTATSTSADLTVLTCTIPGRELDLARNMASVRGQTLRVAAHVVIGDDGTLGTERKYNSASAAVETEWLAILDDDNYWLANHVEAIVPAFDEADVVYSWDAGGSRPRVDLTGLCGSALSENFSDGRNSLDQSCAIRTEMFRRVGGYRLDPSPRTWMDQDLWFRLAEIGARFRAVPVETWVYQISR